MTTETPAQLATRERGDMSAAQWSDYLSARGVSWAGGAGNVTAGETYAAAARGSVPSPGAAPEGTTYTIDRGGVYQTPGGLVSSATPERLPEGSYRVGAVGEVIAPPSQPAAPFGYTVTGLAEPEQAGAVRDYAVKQGAIAEIQGRSGMAPSYDVFIRSKNDLGSFSVPIPSAAAVKEQRSQAAAQRQAERLMENPAFAGLAAVQTALSPAGYEMIGSAVSGKGTRSIVERNLAAELRAGGTTGEAFMRGVTQAAGSPIVEIELAALGGTGLTALKGTALGGRALGSMAGKAALGTAGAVGIGARGIDVFVDATSGRIDAAIGKAMAGIASAGAFVGGAKAQSGYMAAQKAAYGTTTLQAIEQRSTVVQQQGESTGRPEFQITQKPQTVRGTSAIARSEVVDARGNLKKTFDLNVVSEGGGVKVSSESVMAKTGYRVDKAAPELPDVIPLISETTTASTAYGGRGYMGKASMASTKSYPVELPKAPKPIVKGGSFASSGDKFWKDLQAGLKRIEAKPAAAAGQPSKPSAGGLVTVTESKAGGIEIPIFSKKIFPTVKTAPVYGLGALEGLSSANAFGELEATGQEMQAATGERSMQKMETMIRQATGQRVSFTEAKDSAVIPETGLAVLPDVGFSSKTESSMASALKQDMATAQKKKPPEIAMAPAFIGGSAKAFPFGAPGLSLPDMGRERRAYSPKPRSYTYREKTIRLPTGRELIGGVVLRGVKLPKSIGSVTYTKPRRFRI